ncbi:DKNYY family protein [Mariniflexile fucanivorans]|uniref:DKNYY family protein n=1 Tax=Mariniflexile fucanivorans TaxID=264023 RepID=A0A4R1RFW6_9FLAO|nr:DKNYY domain-containing protein [Mariniflexile fucanivorans]TCL64888.1 DKNYY family protein [Mariniflexile fucanivorans]
MKISESLFPNNVPQCREYQIISTIIIKDNRLVENYFRDYKTNIYKNWFINDRKVTPVFFDENDCEWLSPTFIRNKKELYGFSLIEKSNSTKLFLTQVKGNVDFKSFKAIGRFYAKDNNRFYFGPGGKIIKGDSLELFFDDTYKKEWINSSPNSNNTFANLWNSKIAISGERIYWNGKLSKDIHSSLKRITKFFWADNYSVFSYDLQNLKKINDFDRKSLIYENTINEKPINGLVSDKYRPAYCYVNKTEPNETYDFQQFAPLFDKLRGTIDEDYWWYKMEHRLQQKRM